MHNFKTPYIASSGWKKKKNAESNQTESRSLCPKHANVFKEFICTDSDAWAGKLQAGRGRGASLKGCTIGGLVNKETATVTLALFDLPRENAVDSKFAAALEWLSLIMCFFNRDMTKINLHHQMD